MTSPSQTRPTTQGITHNGEVLWSYLNGQFQGEDIYTFSMYPSLIAMFAAVASSTSENIKMIFDVPVVITDDIQKSTLNLSNKKYVSVHNLIVRDSTLYAGSFDLWRIFNFVNISNLFMEVDLESSLEYVGDDKRGLTPLRLKGCDNFTFIGKTLRCYQGYEVDGVKNLYARSYNVDTRYPHLMTNIGTVDINTVNEGCRRDFFLTDNCGGGQITVDALDTQQGTPLKMYFFNGNMSHEMSNLTINYKYRSTGRYVLPFRVAPIWLDWGWDSTTTEPLIKGLMRNITINYDVVGGTWGSVIGTTKLINESIADNSPRGYQYSNINIQGRIEIGGGDASGNGWFFNFNTNDNWVSGDTINAFNCKDLIVRKINGGSLYVNTNQLTGAVNSYGGVTFDNVSAPEATLTASDYSLVRFRDSSFLDFVSDHAVDDSKASAISSTVYEKAAAGSVSVKIGRISKYRNISSWDVAVVANSPFSGVSSAWHGRIQGTLVAATTFTPSTLEGSVQSSFTKGTTATPTITTDSDGFVYLNMVGWAALEATISIHTRMSYNEYSGGANKTVKGMLSQRNSGFLLY